MKHAAGLGRVFLAILAATALSGGLGLAQPAPQAQVAPPIPPPINVPGAPAAAQAAAQSDAASDLAAAQSDVAPVKVDPTKRIPRDAAVIQALDKVTTQTMRFQVRINQPVRYEDLVFTVHACEDSAPDEVQQGSYANVEIDSQPRPAPGMGAPPARQVFKGWLFSNAPGAHPFEHPVYDAWLIACRTAAPGS